jgi:glycosyltransferase involved in cell wall biosynthesis
MSITFIIPYYKLEKELLTRCIDSIIALDDYVDWEILVIDDGTPSTQAKDWTDAYNDKRIRYVLIEHAGLGGARNMGIDLANKEYIQMVDSDDYLFLQHEIEVLKIVQDNTPDALIFNYEKVYSNQHEKPHTEGKVTYTGDAAEYMTSHDIPPSCCRYIIKRSAIGKLRFTPDILHEDEEFSTLLLLNLTHIVVTTYTPYAYFQRGGSIINSQDKANIDRRFSDLLGIIQRIQKVTHTLDSDDRRRKALIRKTHTLSMCFIIDLIRDAYDTKIISTELARLKDTGLYPLPHGKYGLRYQFIRLATCLPILVKTTHSLLLFKKSL